MSADAGHATPAGGSRDQPRRERRGAARPLPDDALIILPVRNVVLFPGMVLPLTVGRERSRAAAQEAARLQRPLGVLLQSKPDVDEPGPDDLHWVGTTANVLRYVTAPDGAHHVDLPGRAALSRAAVPRRLSVHWSRASSTSTSPSSIDAEIEGRAHSLKQRAVEILQLLPQVPEEMVAALQGVEGAGAARRLHRRA